MPTRLPALVPELLVESLDASLAFWRDLCGFDIRYSRPEEGFAYLELGTAHVMLEETGRGRNWVTAHLQRPLGRGINFQIAVASVADLVDAFERACWPLFMAPEIRTYRVDGIELGVVQFLVQDPDGYLIRFQEPG
ncbi:bleomycin resistance protein [Pseudonocardia sp. TRM90224]|uniref:bleomycin resistance protein n=1 Tax=Pseudonocardia sp. TRM90224 TaxID=2812678 RepID=UPI001E42D56A|nr:VOC family protein [Pseudonocardia sp. TRM90224]